MDPAMPETMKAAAIDRFGGPEVFRVRSLSVPKPKPESGPHPAGHGGHRRLGSRDTCGRLRSQQRFPPGHRQRWRGTVVAVGSRVRRFRSGDHVYAYTMKGGLLRRVRRGQSGRGRAHPARGQARRGRRAGRRRHHGAGGPGRQAAHQARRAADDLRRQRRNRPHRGAARQADGGEGVRHRVGDRWRRGWRGGWAPTRWSTGARTT